MRRSSNFYIPFFIGGFAFAAPTISPSTATVVFVGGTAVFSSTDSVTWSLAAGSTGTINSGTGVYTAPRSLPIKNVIAGCPALPNDHIYNTRIDNLPVDSHSATRFASLLGGTTTHIAFEVSFPENIMTNATPTTNMTFLYTPGNNAAFQTLSFPYMGVESGLVPASYFVQDRHVLGVNTDTCEFSEMYNFYPAGSLPPEFGCPSCNSASGVKFNGMSYRLPDADMGGATDAAGMYVQPLSFRYSELKAGAIKHALRFTLDNPDIYSGPLWPATNYTNECSNFANCFPYGSRVRLKSSVDISTYSPTAQVILTALKQYGMFMADGGIAMRIQAMADTTIDTTTWTAIQAEISRNIVITQFQFEQVDESSLMVSSNSGHVNLANAYVTPDNFATIVATKISDGSTSSVAIGIEPVTVGTVNTPFQANVGALSIMAGTPQISIPNWVHGSTTTTVTCTMSPTVGTLTSGCLYTAPATQINVISTATVTITPTSDPTNKLLLPLVIFPSDGIRINVGGKSAFNSNPVIPYDGQGNYGPDADNHMWWSDPIGNAPPWSKTDGGFSQAAWGSPRHDIGLFYTFKGGNQDGAYSAMVPNGFYLLNLGFGLDSSNGTPSQYVQSIDSQGQTLFPAAALSSFMPDTSYTPGTLTYIVQVVNNQFYFAIREINVNNFVVLNNWSLTSYTPLGVQGHMTLQGAATMFQR